MPLDEPPPSRGPVLAPATAPCKSCPYRLDAESGVWDASEYAKLPAYDLPTWEQPTGVFLCHRQDGRLCAGWVGCHDMDNNLGLRLAASTGALTEAVVTAALDYQSSVPLFATGRAAAEHGLAELTAPGEAAQRVIRRLTRDRGAS